MLFIVPLVILVAALATGFMLVWHLFVLSLLVLLVSYLWTTLNIKGVDSHAKLLPRRCQVGESFIQRMTLFNRSRMPKLLLEVRENTSLPGYNNLATFSLPSEGSHSWESEIHCRKRGEYELGSLTVTASDPFGLFPRQQNLGEPQKITICPATLELPLFEPLMHHGTGFGPERWLAGQFGPNVASIREYVGGDSLKRIHWHSTAHANKLMVKTFDPDHTRKIARSVWVLLDMQKTAHMTAGEDSSEEFAVTIAASMVKNYVNDGLPVGLIAEGDRPYLFQPDLGEEHMWHLLTTLALVRATGSMPIDHLVSTESGHFGSESIVIVITASPSDWLVTALRQIRGRGAVVVAILIDPISFGGTASVTAIARTLILNGIQVHVVERGDDLPMVLDSRQASLAGMHDEHFNSGVHPEGSL